MSKNQSNIHFSCAADLNPKPIDWLWKDWLALGKFHLLAGGPGTGKTTLALNLAAIISCGGQWPDGSFCKPANVLIWSGEDHAEDTLLPRLLAQGVDKNRVYFIKTVTENHSVRAFDPAQDIPKLYAKASQIGNIKLIIIDPVVNMVVGDSHKNGEVRRALQHVVELSAQLNAVIIGITHFSKGTLGRDPLERVNGSIAFGALARVVLVTTKTKEAQKYLLVRVKSNHGPNGGAYSYQIEQTQLVDYAGIEASSVVWGDALAGSAETLLASIDQSFSQGTSVLAETIEFLKAL